MLSAGGGQPIEEELVTCVQPKETLKKRSLQRTLCQHNEEVISSDTLQVAKKHTDKFDINGVLALIIEGPREKVPGCFLSFHSFFCRFAYFGGVPFPYNTRPK